MRPIKTGIVVVYMGIVFLTVTLLFEMDSVAELIFYAFGAILIIIGINIFRQTVEKDMSTKIFVPFVGIMTLFMVVVLSHAYFTAGDYRAAIYYEKTNGTYVLKGVEIYAKPENFRQIPCKVVVRCGLVQCLRADRLRPLGGYYNV
jgi:hypothetical protein